jgi:hypothetical protein
VFAFILLDSPNVVNAFVNAQVIFVGESSLARWTREGSLIGR